MGRRATAWFLTLPLSAVGVLAGHALAYRITGAPDEGAHAYLEHASQVALMLATLAVGALAFTSRSRRMSAVPFGILGLLGFPCQEHLERLAHTGEVPWLLTDRTFLAGLALQLPIAALSIALARLILRNAGSARRALPPQVSWLVLTRVTPCVTPAVASAPERVAARGPPSASRS